MRLFSSFLPSFLATAFPTDFPCIFEFWFAYDVGDSLLDSDQVTFSQSSMIWMDGWMMRERDVGRWMDKGNRYRYSARDSDREREGAERG